MILFVMVDTKISACNDNQYSRRFFNDGDGSGSRLHLMTHIPIARQLIKQHVKQSWKHTPEHSDFSFLEYQLCTLLDRKPQSSIQRYFQVSDVAWVLEVSPVMLMNDPDLPF